jgi:ATP-dependent Clp protease ATP-binding subunit ClpC
LRDGDGKAIAILNSIEVNLEELRRKVEILNPAPESIPTSNSLILSAMTIA